MRKSDQLVYKLKSDRPSGTFAFQMSGQLVDSHRAKREEVVQQVSQEGPITAHFSFMFRLGRILNFLTKKTNLIAILRPDSSTTATCYEQV